jgi:hypothetical protein
MVLRYWKNLPAANLAGIEAAVKDVTLYQGSIEEVGKELGRQL